MGVYGVIYCYGRYRHSAFSRREVRVDIVGMVGDATSLGFKVLLSGHTITKLTAPSYS